MEKIKLEVETNLEEVKKEIELLNKEAFKLKESLEHSAFVIRLISKVNKQIAFEEINQRLNEDYEKASRNTDSNSDKTQIKENPNVYKIHLEHSNRNAVELAKITSRLSELYPRAEIEIELK